MLEHTWTGEPESGCGDLGRRAAAQLEGGLALAVKDLETQTKGCDLISISTGVPCRVLIRTMGKVVFIKINLAGSLPGNFEE